MVFDQKNNSPLLVAQLNGNKKIEEWETFSKNLSVEQCLHRINVKEPSALLHCITVDEL